MPTYQYACTECGHGFEQFQSFSDDALTECPTCGGRLRKVFNSVGIVFKGSGFYRNDSREAAAKGKAGKESKDTKDKESVGSKSDSSSDTKSDKQSERVGTGSEKTLRGRQIIRTNCPVKRSGTVRIVRRGERESEYR